MSEKQPFPAFSWSAIFLAIAGLIASGFVVRATPTSPPSSKVADTEKNNVANQGSPADYGGNGTVPAINILREFLGVTTSTSSVVDDEHRDQIEAYERRKLGDAFASNVASLSTLLVMVADPRVSESGHRFDHQVDVLHKALREEGFVPDRFVVPWKDQVPKGEAFISRPGVLLYRRYPGDAKGTIRCDLLFVFLIGESPTLGIDHKAFVNAMEQREKLLNFPTKPAATAVARGAKTSSKKSASLATVSGQKQVSISGPVFSGSGESLALAIKNWNTRQKINNCGALEKVESTNFLVANGSALSLDIKRMRAIAGKPLQITSTVNHVSVARNELLNHVGKNHYGTFEVAWLTESSTGFGQSSMNSSSARISSKAIVTAFQFPLNISHVRTIYGTETKNNTESVIPQQTQRIPIPAEVGGATDVIEMQTPKLTSADVEILLAQIVATITTRQIKYVGITATDPRDLLFLTEFIRKRCPDVQVMSVSTELLHLHSRYRTSMHGVLAATSYSLDPDLHYSYQSNETQNLPVTQQLFASHAYYGMFNAIVLLRGIEKRDLIYFENTNAIMIRPRATNKVTLPIAYGIPEGESQKSISPPVWISRLTPTRIVPVAVVPVRSASDPSLGSESEPTDYCCRFDEGTSGIAVRPTQAVPISPPLSLWLFFLFWTTVNLCYGISVLRTPSPEKTVAPFWPESKEFWPLAHVIHAGIAIALSMPFVASAALIGMQLLGTAGSGVAQVAHWLVAILLILAVLACPIIHLRSAHALRNFRAAVRELFLALRSKRSPRRQVPALKANLRSATAILSVVIVIWMLFLVCSPCIQFVEWRDSLFSRQLWWVSSISLFNGNSGLIALSLLSIAITILLGGLLYQITLLAGDEESNSGRGPIVSPFPDSETQRPDDVDDSAVQTKPANEVRKALLFPLLARQELKEVTAATQDAKRNTARSKSKKWRMPSGSIEILLLVLSLCWLSMLWSRISHFDFYRHLSVPAFMFFIACVLWVVRLFKILQIVKYFVNRLDTINSRGREKLNWDLRQLFESQGLTVAGIQKLLWIVDRPKSNDPRLVDEGMVQSKRQVILLDLYIRQFFFHLTRLIYGLLASGVILLIVSGMFPFSYVPSLRFTVSIMLGVLGAVMVWVYWKLDYNEVISALVGSPKGQLSWDWSMLQSVTPGAALAMLAIVSQVFPEAVEWLGHLFESSGYSSR